MRFLFLCSALSIFASVAFAEGEFQHTKDGKTIVWNNDPKPGDEAAWFGDRDREGYATGFGTLTWYTGKKETDRTLVIPITKKVVYARYFGNMVRGKFEGPVNVHVQGKIDHAIFADGKRTTRWAAGAARTRRIAQQPPKVKPVKEEPVKEPAAPAEGPAPKKKSRNLPSPRHKIDKKKYQSLRRRLRPL